ncbi:MAG: peptidoglycan DD-metalloendopeptidase family protein [Candidatus Moraniibacteriota bacterium]|nr:MAG: peptidoglycan DD-metalloendopeptidase family protein [Candidatus Moranbacteria bacterium]
MFQKKIPTLDYPASHFPQEMYCAVPHERFRLQQRIFVFFLVLLFALGSFSLPGKAEIPPAPALTPEQEALLKKAQDEKENSLDALKDKIRTYEKIVKLKKNEEEQLVMEAQKLDAQSSSLEGNITENTRRLADLRQEIESLESRIGEKETLIRSQRELLADILRSYDASQSTSVNTTSLILASPEDFDRIMNGRDRLFEIGNGVQEMLSNIIRLRDTLFRDKSLADEKKIQIENVKMSLEQQNAYLETTKRKKELLAAAADAEQKKYGAIISDLEKQRKEIESEIEELDAARAGKINLKSIPQFKGGVLGYPVSAPKKSQSYGKTSFTRWYTFHNGVDFSGSIGTPILAAEDGTIIAMGDEGKYAYGKWMAVRHENGLTTLYGHLSKYLAKKGEKVSRGEKIGLMGNTGYSTGPHVHFSVFSSDSFEVVDSKNIKGITLPTGAHINPEKYL